VPLTASGILSVTLVLISHLSNLDLWIRQLARVTRQFANPELTAPVCSYKKVATKKESQQLEGALHDCEIRDMS